MDTNHELKGLMKALDDNLRYLKNVKADPILVGQYKRLIKHLRSLGEDEMLQILTEKQVRKVSQVCHLEEGLSDEQIKNMKSDDVEALLSDSSVTRKFLNRVSALRFSLTAGELSSLTSREILAERIQSLIDNEKTHEAIKRLASEKE